MFLTLFHDPTVQSKGILHFKMLRKLQKDKKRPNIISNSLDLIAFVVVVGESDEKFVHGSQSNSRGFE